MLAALRLPLVLALLPFAACTSASPTDGGPTDAHADARDAITADSNMPLPGDILSVAIEPADYTVTSTNGVTMPDPHYHAVGVRRDGMRVPLTTGVFSIADDRLGAITSDGTFTANGIAGGTTQVIVDAAAGPHGEVLRATTGLTVRIQRDITAPGTPPDASTTFVATPAVMDAARAVQLLYPLDGALMPNNVAAPDLQWDRGNAGDLYRVRITKPHLAITGYLLHTGAAFAYHWQVDRDAWRSVAETDPSDPANIAVDRLDTAMSSVVTGPSIQVRLTHGGIFGAVYYFDFALGRERRIDPSTGLRVDLVPNPPITSTRHDRCLGCHTVSRDGRYLAAAAGGDVAGAAVFDLTTDLTPDPAPTLFPMDRIVGAFFYTFSPDSSQLMTASGAGALGLVDPHSGMSLAATGLPTTHATHPEWSPDGSSIAHIQASDLGGDIFTHGDLALMPRTGPLAFAAATVIHRGADLVSAVEGGEADAHPTWSPDGRLIAFAHGPHSYSYSSSSPIVPRPSALYVVTAAGGTAVRLNNAVGGPTATLSYWPTFSPFVTVEPTETGAYYWLAFGSRRDYGNAQVGTRGTNRLQLWVTAIRVDASGTVDTSNVPYWLPGQDTATGNFGAYWAGAPCRTNGADCALSAECCSSRCVPDPGSPTHTVCAPPPTSECRHRGQTCGGDSDCCTGLTCFGNVCDVPPG